MVRGNLRRAQGRLQDARTSLLKAVQLLEELRATSTFSYARAQTYLGAIYLDENSLDLAIKRLQGALGQNLQLFGDDHFETANTYALLSAAWIRRGDLQRGRSLLDDAKRGLSDKMQASLLRARVNELEGELRLREDDVGAAGKLVESACHIYEAVPGVDRIRLIDCLQNLARIYRKAGRNADADALSARALKIRGISSRQKTADVLQAKC